MSPPELTTKHCTRPGLPKCSEKVLFPFSTPLLPFVVHCLEIWIEEQRNKSSGGSQVTEPLLGNATSLFLLDLYVRCPEVTLVSGVSGTICFAKGCKSPSLFCFREGSPAETPGARSWGISSQLSSEPASVLLDCIGMRPNPPSIYHLCGCGI